MKAPTQDDKKCLYCKEPLTGKRADAKFCNNTCKAKYWEAKHQETAGKEERKSAPVTSQLRGVLNANGGESNSNTFSSLLPEYKTIVFPQYNPEKRKLEQEIRRLLDVKKQSEQAIRELQQDIKQVQADDGKKWLWGLGGIGAILGNNYTKNRAVGILVGATYGLLTGAAVREHTTQQRETDKKQLTEKMQQLILQKQQQIKEIDTSIRIMKEQIKGMPSFTVGQEQVPVTMTKLQENTSENKDENTKNHQNEQIEKNIPEPGKPLPDCLKTSVEDTTIATGSDKIISSTNLSKMEFRALNFQDRWREFFGFPSINFHCVLHGMSGEGKSTFAIQFAKYLADNFGKVIYISGEEGFSKTFRDKFQNNRAASSFLDVADLRSFDDIIREVPEESYNFIFIDSLDNMKIDADKMKQIRKRYPDAALVTISQSTKDGKMRGSYEIVHDSDIAVKVENGIATTTKNRFKEKGMLYTVFKRSGQ